MKTKTFAQGKAQNCTTEDLTSVTFVCFNAVVTFKKERRGEIIEGI